MRPPITLAAALLGGTMLAAQGPQSRSAWDLRAEGAGEYETVLELSGRYEIALYRSFADPLDLRSLCDAAREQEAESMRDARLQLELLTRDPGAAADPLEVAWAKRTLGQLHAYFGEMAESAAQLQEAYDIVSARATTPELRGAQLMLERVIGVAHLRRGELDNCIHHRNPARCIFPIRGGGIHSETSGSERAIEYLTRALARTPDDLETRWLLNVAYMTLGRYPGDVPDALRIEPAAFEGGRMPPLEDVAAARGIDVRSGAGGSALDDFDNDGDLDIVLSAVGACDPLRIYRNRGDGTFDDVSERAGVLEQTGGLNLSHADYDNDGLLDIFVHRGGWEAPMRNSLLRNKGDGTFTDVTEHAGLLEKPAHRTHTAAWGDYDNDGRLDLFVGHEQSPSMLYRNRGDGTFEEVGAKAGVRPITFVKGAAWGDYDNDGFLDLYVSNFAEPNLLYRNKGDGTFEEVAAALGVDRPLMSFATWFFDYDNDGWLDLYVANFVPSVTEVVRGFLGLPPRAETMRLYRNNGRGGFEDVTERVGLARVSLAMGANFGDIDNDGFLDFYLGTGAPSYAALVPNVLFRNENGQRFVDVTSSSGTGHLQKGHGVSFGDVDGDGSEELLVNVGGFVPGDAYWKTLFRSEGPRGRWVTLRLTGTRSNRFGAGARITVHARMRDGSVRQIHRVVSTGGSFGASPYRQHIGLGDAESIQRIEVWWPASGVHQVLTDEGIDRTVEIVEAAAGR
ncbi:MAG TPA: CRTAC1 family protein [Vicinamibacterales bacterium]